MGVYIFKQIRENRMNAFKTYALMLSFVGNGLYQSALGPSLLDFELAVGVSMSDWIIQASMVGYVAGGFVLFHKINPFLCDVLSLLCSAVFTVLIPYNRRLVGLLLSVMINGVFLGIIDAIGTMMVLVIWGKECNAFMQLLHFGFGIGAILGPLIVSPFLLPFETDARMQFLNTLSSRHSNGYNAENLRFQTAYVIYAVYMATLSLLFLYIFLRHPDTRQHPSRTETSESNLNVPQINRTMLKTVICLGTAFMHVYYGIEVAIGTYLTKFGFYSELHLSKETGALITSVYWATSTIFLLIAVLYANKVGPGKIIIFELIIIMLANCILVPFGSTNVYCIWIGAAIIGIGMSAIWATIFGYFENYYRINAKIAAGFTISARLGEFIVPIIMGSAIKQMPMMFLWIVLTGSLLSCILFIVINFLCENYLYIKSPAITVT